MSNNMESPNSEPLERDGGAEAVTSIPDSSSVEHAVSPLLKRRRFGTTEEPHEDESNDDEDDPDGFKPYTPSSSPQFLYRNPSSSFRSVFKPLSKTFLYCHSHTPRPQVPLFFVKGLSASAVQATVATAPKATSPDEKGMKPQWKAIDFKWIRENKDDVAWVGLERSSVGHWWLDNIGKAFEEGKTYECMGSRQLAGLFITLWGLGLLRYKLGVELGLLLLGSLGC